MPIPFSFMPQLPNMLNVLRLPSLPLPTMPSLPLPLPDLSKLGADGLGLPCNFARHLESTHESLAALGEDFEGKCAGLRQAIGVDAFVGATSRGLASLSPLEMSLGPAAVCLDEPHKFITGSLQSALNSLSFPKTRSGASGKSD